MIFSSPILLASASPRRKSLLNDLGIKFEVKIKEVNENYPDNFKKEQVALHIAEKKAAAYEEEVLNGYTVITADTIVCLDDHILGKPENREDAFRMLKLLSGKKHEVITAVCIKNTNFTDSFYVLTSVYFKELTDEEISYYIEKDKPFDKAGSYGIQDWLGLIAIERIEGSYYNVVGLPVCELYQHLVKFKTFSEL